MIKANELLNFEAEKSYEVIGKNGAGQPTTVMEEFVQLYKMCDSYFDTFARYVKAKRRTTQWAVELSEEEIESLYSRVLRKLEAAAKKALWLNTQAREYGYAFITERVNIRDPKECNTLVWEIFDMISEFCAENSDELAS